MPNRRVLVVEDEALMRSVLCDALRAEGFDVRGAATASEARTAAARFDPDLVVLDIDLGPGPTGADLGRILASHHPGIALLYLTRLPDLRAAGSAVPSGTAHVGFVRKDTIGSTAEFVEAVEAVIRGVQAPPRHDTDPRRPLGKLTDTQVEVLRMAAAGLSNQAIADERATSIGAVEANFTNIYRALGVPNTADTNQRSVAIARFLSATGALARR